MKVLVTGGAGFIGSHVVEELVTNQHSPVVIDSLVTGNKNNLPSNIPLFVQDIKDRDGLVRLMKQEKVEAVIHLAAQKSVTASVTNPIYDMEENILGSLTLFETMNNLGIHKLVFASTGGALYGDATELPTPENHTIEPISPYGIAKFSIENYLRFYRLTHQFTPVILRLSNVYGPRQDPKGEAGVIAIFCNKLIHNEAAPVFGDGTQTRDYIYVTDVAKAFVNGLELKESLTANIGTGQETTLLTIIKKLAEVSGKNFQPDLKEKRPGELMRSVLNCNQAKEGLHWTSEVSLADGLKLTYNYFQGI